MVLTAAAISISACGRPAVPAETPQTTPVSDEVQDKETTRSTLKAIGDVALQKELFDVKITIPSEYIGDQKPEELKSAAKEAGKVISSSDSKDMGNSSK